MTVKGKVATFSSVNLKYQNASEILKAVVLYAKKFNFECQNIFNIPTQCRITKMLYHLNETLKVGIRWIEQKKK